MATLRLFVVIHNSVLNSDNKSRIFDGGGGLPRSAAPEYGLDSDSLTMSDSSTTSLSRLLSIK